MTTSEGRPCPCCAAPMVALPTGGPVELSEARSGDGWCENCRWVLLREVVERRWPANCPTHGTEIRPPAR
jgi:hypothetical protein